jgi:hypothetical protein
MAQLKRWSVFTEPSKIPGGSDRIRITGKGHNGTMPDDLAMALLLNHAVARLLLGVCSAKYNIAQFSKTGIILDN